ncbi:MAG TPA: hypothetical protein DEF57_01125 [Candidatus Magasanikbacteria bacterium]|nr:hypothetical protein [Candidatus Magasanikbacteria bacterium]
MQGIVLHCPNISCKKLLLKDANLPPTTNFKLKCFWCGRMVNIKSDFKRITLQDLEKETNEIGISFIG